MNIVLFDIDEIKMEHSCGVLPIDDERAQHCIKVLHKTVGDTFEAGIVGEKAGIATITSIDNDEIHFSFEALTDGKNLYPLTMIVGFPRPIQLRRLFRDMAGLGVAHILLCGTELGEKSYMKSDLVTDGTAEKLLREGSVQAASTHIPKLELYNSLSECLEMKKSTDIENVCVALDNEKPECSLGTILKKFEISSKSQVFAAIGSERGWSDNERKLLCQSGFTLCSMGTRVLRTETAATVAASVILEKMGVLI